MYGLTSTAASSAGAAAAGTDAAEGMAISWIFSRVCRRKPNEVRKRIRARDGVLALSSETRSAAWRRVRPEMSSTMRPILGSTGVVFGGGEASAAVASHLDRPVCDTSLAKRQDRGERGEEGGAP